jgi:hypothetical protein
MGKIFKLLIASLLTASLGMATVLCCCVAPSVMAHFHKVTMCSHCSSQNSSPTHSSVPDTNCLYKLTNAEVLHSNTISFSALAVYIHGFFFDHHITRPFLPSVIAGYPRGSPPLTASFIPLYLRTFTLRI